MAGPRRMFGFMKNGSKHKRGDSREHRRTSIDEHKDSLPAPNSNKDQQIIDLVASYQEDDSQLLHDDIISSHESGAVTLQEYQSQDDTYFTRPEDEEPTQSSNQYSLNHKPTIVTLGETFSSGGVHELLDYCESRDESVEVQDSEYFYSEHPHNHADYQHNQYDDEDNNDEPIQHDNGYTEFIQGTQEEEDADTLDYTATVHPQDLVYNHSDSMAARHERGDEYNLHVEEGIEAQWEDTSLGYETCERTLNTNLEGMNYISNSPIGHEEPITSFGLSSRMSRIVLSHGGEYSNGEVPQYYYSQGDDEQQESYGGEGYYYDDEGHFIGQSYQEGEDNGEYFDGNDDFNTIANSTIATEGFDTVVGQQPIISTSFLQSSSQAEDDDSAPLESYESEESGSSWGDEETRDMSLLDEEGDTVVDGKDDDAGSVSDNSKSESDDSDVDSPTKREGRRHRGKKSMMDLLTEMKDLALNGGGESSDDDEEEDMPGVAQISTGATSATHSYDSDDSGDRPRKQKPRRKKHSSNLDNLFDKVSALGQEVSALGHELLGDEPTSKRKGKGKKPLRRKGQDPASKIVDSLRDIFNCGHPKHY